MPAMKGVPDEIVSLSNHKKKNSQYIHPLLISDRSKSHNLRMPSRKLVVASLDSDVSNNSVPIRKYFWMTPIGQRPREQFSSTRRT